MIKIFISLFQSPILRPPLSIAFKVELLLLEKEFARLLHALAHDPMEVEFSMMDPRNTFYIVFSPASGLHQHTNLPFLPSSHRIRAQSLYRAVSGRPKTG